MLLGLGLGVSAQSAASTASAPPAPPSGLAAPGNLFSVAQSAFDTSAHIDLRGNWDVLSGRLTALGNNANDARVSLDAPLVAGHHHIATFDFAITSGNLKMSLGGNGSFNGASVTEDWQGFQNYKSTDVGGAFTRVQPKPTSNFSGSIDGLAIYDLSTTDPKVVQRDVIIYGGDSNSANATSDFVTKANRETAFDPRIWYMPPLRNAPTFNPVGAERHVPFPMIEPVIAAPAARRMSPVHAAASELVSWSAARGRPLLILALGDPGSGLMNTQDWRAPARREGTGATVGRMWDEMVAMKTALEALTPNHQVVGAMWSLGQNDGFSASSAEDYDTSHTVQYNNFFTDVRTLFGNIPMVLSNINPDAAADSDANGNQGFGSFRQTWIRRFDKDSGHPNSVNNLTVLEPASGNQYTGDGNQGSSDPHYSATGIQALGRQMGQALRGVLG